MAPGGEYACSVSGVALTGDAGGIAQNLATASGVDDDGNALGLDNDYSCLSKKNRDGFLLTLTNLINQKLGKNIHKYITINIISLNEKDVCIVSVEKSNGPVFCGQSENEKFYIRASASSQPLAIQESYKYISSHWEK